MSQVCMELPWWAHPIVFLVLFTWEAFLGKKQFFGEGSTMGLVAMGVTNGLKNLLKRRHDNDI